MCETTSPPSSLCLTLQQTVVRTHLQVLTSMANLTEGLLGEDEMSLCLFEALQQTFMCC